ncbi:gliding motility-associated C-terminal domain-containing protein [Pedobacter mucosus]|uniref:gliding motility-associated C-terminal domain-containing protein n=1 Tax=Pedobacter mucosus TaxID=2895286 RepID=UPI001EE46BD1|nr:gliding motility-associated C-terminal domain-containing protein [Pedobacter mucosus]UKT65358.1 gliding motility-associated C-terminal domain-containing protein [Pedobacter mucosus]
MFLKLNFNTLLLTCLLLSFPFITKGQLNLTIGESFLEDQSFKQVFVSVEDHTVWGLTQSGNVFYKKEGDEAFNIYPLTNGLNIAQITGYNASEMYFLIKPDLIIHVRNETKHEIKVNYPGVTRINDISIISSKRDIAYYRNNPQVRNEDYLAIATNKHMYKIFRGNLTIDEQQSYANQPLVDEPDWHITNAGFKSVDFQYIYPTGQCFVNNHATISYKAYTSFISALPDRTPYPSKINCTLFAHHWQDTSGWQIYCNIWGTDEGLFAKNMGSCTEMEIKKVILNEKINDIEEAYALTAISKQNFVFAATDRGLYYTPASIFYEIYASPNPLDRIKFVNIPALANSQISSLCIDTYKNISLDYTSGQSYDTMCEKVLWVASEKGIKKIYLTLDQVYYSKIRHSDFIYEKPPSNGYNQPEIIYETCGDQTVKISSKISSSLYNQLLFQWFKDDVEIIEWIGKPKAELKEAGTYTLKITALCENISLMSLPIVIKHNASPEIVFNYPDEINLCPNSAFTLQTKLATGYKYKWIKDGLEIINETQNIYNASVSGIYQVQVSNCDSYSEISKSVKINLINFIMPLLNSLKTNYCVGETAEILVENPLNYKTKWFRNGIELSELANKNAITVNISGAYVISFISDNNCSISSLAKNITFTPLPIVEINRSSNKVLCYGETVTLTANTNQIGSNFIWNTGETTAGIEIKKSGSFYVSFINSSGCTARSDIIKVIINNPLKLLIPEEQKICVIINEKVMLEAESGFVFYTWNGQKTNSQFYEVRKAGNYTLVVEDFYGCTKELTYKVMPYCMEILIPNAFSPNGDNINDLWQVSGLEDDYNAKIKIYNRFGNTIYTTIGKNAFWDGKVNGSFAPVGTYYYSIESKNAKQLLKGAITLIR